MFLSKDNYIKECLKGHKRHKRQKNCPKFHPDVSGRIQKNQLFELKAFILSFFYITIIEVTQAIKKLLIIINQIKILFSTNMP